MTETIVKMLYIVVGVFLFLGGMVAFIYDQQSLYEMEQVYKEQSFNDGHIKFSNENENLIVQQEIYKDVGIEKGNLVHKGYVLKGEALQALLIEWKNNDDYAQLYYNLGKSDQWVLEKVDQKVDVKQKELIGRIYEDDNYLCWQEEDRLYILSISVEVVG